MQTDSNNGESASGVKHHINKHNRKYILLALVVVLIVIVISALFSSPSSPIKNIYTKKPTAVEVKTTYKNPFDKNTQYVNPFDKYKNPFVTNR